MTREEKPLDEALLGAVAGRLGSLTMIDTVRVFPPQQPASVVATFDDVYYPDEVQRVLLELRAFQNGDFNVTYREVWSRDGWMIRWDRHENPHNARDHCHRPPHARKADAADETFPEDFFDVVELILSEVDGRLGDVWNDVDSG